MKNFKKVLLFCGILLSMSSISNGGGNLSVPLRKASEDSLLSTSNRNTKGGSKEELSGNTQHNQQIINQLSPEVYKEIVTFIPKRDRSRFAQTCKDFNSIERTTPVSLEIFNARLNKFDSLMEYLSNHNVVELFLLHTNITDEQLTDILNQIGGNLKTLILLDCRNLNNFEAIGHWSRGRNIELY